MNMHFKDVYGGGSTYELMIIALWCTVQHHGSTGSSTTVCVDGYPVLHNHGGGFNAGRIMLLKLVAGTFKIPCHVLWWWTG